MSSKGTENLEMVRRVHKLRGQLAAVERSLAANGDCAKQLMQLAALRGGVNALMREVLETHIRLHLTDGAREKIAPELAEDLLGLVRSYLK
jgi:DNA-binding FrmR family transcriptional regulator